MSTSKPFSQGETPIFAISAMRCEGEHAFEHGCAFQVAWSINPHMQLGSVDLAVACAQQAVFRHVLTRLGARLVELPFVHGAFDSVFVKDNAILLRRAERHVALLGTPRHPERQREQEARAEYLERLGFAVLGPMTSPLEGGDVVMLPGRHGALLGHGFRSARTAVRALEQFIDAPVLPLELVDPGLYHLDTALAVLSDGTALVCEDAFRPTSLAALRDHPAIHRWIRVPRAEAMRFGANLVEVGDTVVVNRGARWTRALLELVGRRVVQVDLDQFHRAGGSAACLLARVHEEARVSVSDTTAMRSTSA